MRRLFLIALACAIIVPAQAASVTLNGQIRDFCAPSLSGCTQLADFEGTPFGGVTGMVSSTLNSTGLPTYVGNGAGNTTTENFNRWFVDSPGFNIMAPFSLTLNETAPGSGVYAYANSSFFPLDNQLYGNQGRSHNYHFTLHLAGSTTFKASDTFTFTGDDDLWIYVGGKLAVDLGGVHLANTQTITGADLMLLGLLQDTVYGIDVFFAERHTTESNFNITTSFRFVPGIDNPGNPVPELTTWALMGLGLVAIGVRARA